MVLINNLRQGWMPVLVIVVGLTMSYWPTLELMVEQWLNNDDFSHGLLIIPISLYLIWERRQRLTGYRPQSDWRALSVLVLAILLLVVGELGAELFTIRVSLLIFFIATLWLLYGWELIKASAFPLAFLFLMLPLPGFIYRNLTFPLQILSSKWAVGFLHLWGIMAYREGNVIDLGFTQFQVVEACNGLRFILPLFTLGVLFAFWKKRPLWKRLILIAATVPIAIFANVLRIGGTGVLSKFFGPEVAEGFFHGFSGWAVFMLSFGLFFILNYLLSLLPGEASETEDSADEPDVLEAPEQSDSASGVSMATLGVALVLILATPLVVKELGNVPPRPLQRPLSDFPLSVEGYLGKPDTMDATIWEKVGGQSYFIANYYHEKLPPISFYVAYYEYQRKAGDFIHSPKLCLPGAGWYFEVNHTRQIGLPDKKTLAFNELVSRKGDHSQLVYYWYQGRDRNFTNEFAAKFWMVWDGIWRRRTDGALVRIITNLRPNQPIEDAQIIMDKFAANVAMELNSFLP
jgi:exosortase D (VPLPA-CTERM-specific)